jgi:hypothetical protein
VKPRRTLLTDPTEIAQLSTGGRWKEGKPLVWKVGDAVYAEADVLKEWREKQSIGKISGTSQAKVP